MNKKQHIIKSVPVEVKKALSDYCKERGISQAYFLQTDKRLKSYIK